VAPSEERGQWDLGVRGLSAITSCRHDEADQLPALAANQLRACSDLSTSSRFPDTTLSSRS